MFGKVAVEKEGKEKCGGNELDRKKTEPAADSAWL